MTIEKSRIQPHSTEAEEAVLGCILTEHDYVSKALDYILVSEIFYSNRCKKLWELMYQIKIKKS